MSVFVGLGTNLGDRAAMLDAAVARLAMLPGVRVVRRSAAIETPAMLPPDDATAQPDYLNAVVELETAIEPRALLKALKQLERDLGRRAAKRWAPREIDLDLLLWNEEVIREPGFELPHPGIPHRLFVLRPLAELAPELRHPVLGKTIAALLKAIV